MVGIFFYQKVCHLENHIYICDMKKVKTNMGAKYSMMECEIHISKLDDMVFVLNKSTETIKSIKLTIKNESEKIHHPKPNFSSI